MYLFHLQWLWGGWNGLVHMTTAVRIDTTGQPVLSLSQMNVIR